MLPALFLTLLTLPPVDCGKSAGAGDALKLFLGLGLLLPVPAPAPNAAASAPFAPAYVFTGALAFDAPGVFLPNAVDAPSKAAFREFDLDEVDSWLAKVEARDGLRGAAIRACEMFGWPRDHRQNGARSERAMGSPSFPQIDEAQVKRKHDQNFNSSP
jgi:hypothetical protein